MGDVVVAVEPNGFQGSRPEVLRVASRMGDAVCVCWNVNLHCRFSYSVGGELVTSFDPLHTEWRFGSDPDRLMGEMATLPFGIDNDPDGKQSLTSSCPGHAASVAGVPATVFETAPPPGGRHGVLWPADGFVFQLFAYMDEAPLLRLAATVRPTGRPISG